MRPQRVRVKKGLIRTARVCVGGGATLNYVHLCGAGRIEVPMTTAHPLRIPYGPDSSQFLLFHRPQTPPPHAIVIILHGGFWKSEYGIDPPTAAIETLPPDLLSHNYTVAEVEYRRSGAPGWGYPGTNQDVLAAYRLVTQRSDINVGRVFLLGHSAGGTLALWLAAHEQASGGLVPTRTFALAPVADLREAVRLRLSDDGDAVQRYMDGDPDEIPERYKCACPMDLIDKLSQVNVTLVTGFRDVDVPPSLVYRLFELVELTTQTNGNWEYRMIDSDHYELVSAATKPWAWVRAKILAENCKHDALASHS